ncbi:hypothetical protein PLANPX_1966 [Lacipirellula parvula]|uniref:PDZ domain-containing protein n=2 Tax=Lacipirellula parvula TaxID=2650471 RepID=A0A5K7X6K5_9BACT|nr:hypothetical protein PLANPX_1966 [Lacipirellula parvula]
MKGFQLRSALRSLRRAWLLAGGLVASLFAAPLAVAQAPDVQAEIAKQGESPAEPEPAAAPEAPPEVAAAIKQLEGDQYAARQAAQRTLIAIGAPALEPTAQAAAKGGLETSTRAAHILWAWADSADQTLAIPALEKLATLAQRPVEAAEAQRRLADLREAAAIAAIKELGGFVEMDRTFAMMGAYGTPLQITLNKDWKGGAEGLKHIALIRNATTLSVHGAPLGDEALPELEKLANVKRMEFFGQKFTPELVDKSREKLPATLIDIRKGGARLGIRGLDAQEIVADSPAAKAGLIIGDKITAFEGKPIATFEELTAAISDRMPGDTVTIKFTRAGEERETKVTFDRWGDKAGAGRALPDAPPSEQGLFGPVPRITPLQRVPFDDRPTPTSPSDPLPK